MGDAIPGQPTIDLLVEQILREAAGMSDFELDEALAVAVARRDVAAAHGRGRSVVWANVAIAFDELRAARADVAREVEHLTAPPAPDSGDIDLPGGAS